jgi:hypothetical protein
MHPHTRARKSTVVVNCPLPLGLACAITLLCQNFLGAVNRYKIALDYWRQQKHRCLFEEIWSKTATATEEQSRVLVKNELMMAFIPHAQVDLPPVLLPTRGSAYAGVTDARAPRPLGEAKRVLDHAPAPMPQFCGGDSGGGRRACACLPQLPAHALRLPRRSGLQPDAAHIARRESWSAG